MPKLIPITLEEYRSMFPKNRIIASSIDEDIIKYRVREKIRKQKILNTYEAWKQVNKLRKCNTK